MSELEQQQQEPSRLQAKPGKKRNLRQRRTLEEETETDDTPEIQKELLADLKLLQKQRKRVAGVDASKWVPADSTADDEAADNALMDAQYVKAEVNIKSQILDEEAHMQRYVEQQLASRLGKSTSDTEQKLSKQEQEERELYRMPEGLQAKLTQEVSLPGMMTAITEVEVSKESKMRKIEETEAVKAKMLSKNTARDGDAVEGAAGTMNVRRGQFAFSFGKQQKRQLDIDQAELREKRKYITDRTKDPKDLARMQKKR